MIYNIPNYLRKFLGLEDLLTIQTANFMRVKGIIFHHTFNEAKRSRTMMSKLKGFGVMTGIPDFLIFESRGGFSGLAIELKVIYASGKKNYCSEYQKKAQEVLTERGWSTHTAWTFDEFEEILEAYMSHEPNILPNILTAKK